VAVQAEIRFTSEFSDVYDMIETTKNCVYLAGNAGTGKSTFLRYFKDHTKKRVAVLSRQV